LYLISWGLSEGGNVISNDGECVFYGVLDIFSKGIFALGLVFLAKQLDFKRLGLWMHDHGRISPGYGETGNHEKVRAEPSDPGTGGARDSGMGYDGYDSRGGPRETGVASEATATSTTHPTGV